LKRTVARRGHSAPRIAAVLADEAGQAIATPLVMRLRRLLVMLLSGFLYGAALATVAHADSSDLLGADRIDSLCHPWSASACLVRMAATLHGATSGGPLRGKRLRFVAGNTLLCTATTDQSGRAACLGVAPSGQSLAQTGYRVVFDGDDHFWSESAFVRAATRSTVTSE
jgi:hypothetical protein